jgi:hypothetical protein
MSDAKVAAAVRLVAIVNAVAWLALGVGWYTGAAWALALWPWPEAPMTFVFLASIAASIMTVWAAVAWTGELAALSGVGVNVAVASGATFVHLWRLEMPAPAAAALAGAVGGVLLFVWARRQPVRDGRAMPALVRAAFVLFTLPLIVAGSALTLSRQVFPWPLHPAGMAVVGAIFLGAAAYFVHAALQSRWVHAAPPLWGFLVYDLVLFGPYFRLLGGAGGAALADDYYGGSAVNLLSLQVYLSVLGVSAAVAAYALLMHPSSRLWRRRVGAQPS